MKTPCMLEEDACSVYHGIQIKGTAKCCDGKCGAFCGRDDCYNATAMTDARKQCCADFIDQDCGSTSPVQPAVGGLGFAPCMLTTTTTTPKITGGVRAKEISGSLTVTCP